MIRSKRRSRSFRSNSMSMTGRWTTASSRPIPHSSVRPASTCAAGGSRSLPLTWSSSGSTPTGTWPRPANRPNFENYAEAFGRWFDVRAVRIGAPAERQIAILFNDVTARRVAEDRLRASEALARDNVERVQLALAAGAIIGTWHWDIPTDRLTVDEAFARAFGLDPALGREGVPLAQFVAAVHPDDQAGLTTAMTEATARGRQLRAPVSPAPRGRSVSLDRGERPRRSRPGRHTKGLPRCVDRRGGAARRGSGARSCHSRAARPHRDAGAARHRALSRPAAGRGATASKPEDGGGGASSPAGWRTTSTTCSPA